MKKKKPEKSKGKIKSINLRNFQGHTNSTITLDPGITAIIGESDAGKSSIIRAIKWVATNRPLGIAYRNYDANAKDPFKAMIKFDDDTQVGLDKKKYIINDKSIEKFGTTIPYEVEDTIALTDLNIQNQHDKYFLLQDTPGNVAKRLNELVNLDIIDFVLKNVNSDIRAINKETEEYRVKVGGTKDAIDVYKRLPHVEELVLSLEDKVSTCEADGNTLDVVQTIYTSIMINKDKIKNITEWLNIEKAIEEIVDLFAARTMADDDLISVESSVEIIEEYQERISIHDHILTAEPKIEKLYSVIIKGDTAQKEINGVSVLLSNLELNLEGLSALEIEITDKKQQLIDLLLSAKVCPFCGCKTTKEDIQKHVENMA